MTKLASRLLVLSLLLAPGFARAAEPAKPDAVAAAKAWLALVDAGQYGPSWRESGALFRRAVTEEQWGQALTGARTPLGTMKSRELDTRTEAATLPGAPDGRYEVMHSGRRCPQGGGGGDDHRVARAERPLAGGRLLHQVTGRRAPGVASRRRGGPFRRPAGVRSDPECLQVLIARRF